MAASWSRLDRWTRWLLVAAFIFGAGLLIAAFTVSAYNGTVSQTLVQANGEKVIFIIAIPLVGALLAIGAILVRLEHTRTGVGAFTWLVIGALGGCTFLGMLAIGPFVAPVPACLLIAAVRIKDAGEADS